MCQSFDKLLHMYIAPKTMEPVQKFTAIKSLLPWLFLYKNLNNFIFKKKKKSPLKTILINK